MRTIYIVACLAGASVLSGTAAQEVAGGAGKITSRTYTETVDLREQWEGVVAQLSLAQTQLEECYRASGVKKTVENLTEKAKNLDEQELFRLAWDTQEQLNYCWDPERDGFETVYMYPPGPTFEDNPREWLIAELSNTEQGLNKCIKDVEYAKKRSKVASATTKVNELQDNEIGHLLFEAQGKLKDCGEELDKLEATLPRMSREEQEEADLLIRVRNLEFRLNDLEKHAKKKRVAGRKRELNWFERLFE